MGDKRKSNIHDIKKQMKTVNTEIKDGVFIFTGPMTIGEFAESIKKQPKEIITKFFMKGEMYNINHTLDEEKIAQLCLDYDLDFQKEEQVDATNFMDVVEIKDDEKALKTRPPIITIMGHVDHGKTTLIDKIRNSKISEGEAGGITQHTGAYQIEYNKHKITFLDTPGHEAFTAMRARGAKLTDIVVIVVAADDGVMPQTKEAIDHTISAGVPLIVFINKIDKQGADIEKVKGELSQIDVVAEDWGGNTQFVYGSALTGEGIDKLFEAINLQSEMLELKANPDRLAIGTVIESRIDKGRGAVATLIVTNGALQLRDFIVAGSNYGRIRSMHDSNGTSIKEAQPGTPVVITGLNYTPKAGDKFFGFHEEKFAKNLANEKAFADKQSDLKTKSMIQIKDGVKAFNVVIKSDVQGTAEAVKYVLADLKNDEVIVNVVRASVGDITKSDVTLAQASNAVIYGFNTKPSGDVKAFAEKSKVQIESYSIIYKMIEDVKKVLSGMMAPKYEEQVTGQAVIKLVIHASKIGNIAGCEMTSGIVYAGSKLRLIRAGELIHDGQLDSLQREQNIAKSVENGKEFGCHIKKFNEIKEGDILEFYADVEVTNA